MDRGVVVHDDHVELTCACCGFKQKFKTFEEAFQAGWDEPTHLPSWPVSCHLCPGVFSLPKPAGHGFVPQWHAKQHRDWERDGRPEEFDLEFALKQGSRGN